MSELTQEEVNKIIFILTDVIPSIDTIRELYEIDILQWQ